MLLTEGITPSMSCKGNCWDSRRWNRSSQDLRLNPSTQNIKRESATRILVCLNILKCSTTPSDDIRQTAILAPMIMKITITKSTLEAVSTFRG